MRSILKCVGRIGFDIFGNKASMVFAAIVIGWGVTACYNWLQEYRAKAVAVEKARQTAQELEQAKKVQQIYSDELQRVVAASEEDQRVMVDLKTHADTQRALADEALRQLANANASMGYSSEGIPWADLKPPGPRQRVLALSLERLRTAPTGDSTECAGDPSRCAVDGLRNDILQQLNGTADAGRSDRE